MNSRDLLLAGLSPASGRAHTPVQVQKLFFLIDANISGEIGGAAFRFAPYDYGPFDAAVYRGLDRLAAEGLVDIQFDPGLRTRCYRLTEHGQAQGATLLAGLSPRAQDYIRRASEFVRSLSFEELIAAIYKAYPAMKVNSVFRD